MLQQATSLQHHDSDKGTIMSNKNLNHVFSAAIPHTTRAFYGNSPQIHNDIKSNLEVGQGVY